MKTIHTLFIFLLAAAMPCGLLAEEIEVSKLDKKKTDARRGAFSEWMGGEEFEDFCDEQKKAGKHILYIEENGKYEYRGIFGEINPKGWYFYYSAREENLLREHKEHLESGLKLMTLSESRSDEYSGVWILESTFGAVSAQLEKYGIGLAKIEE